MKTIHYKDKNGNVYGYKPSGIAVTEMSVAEFKKFKAEQETQAKSHEAKANIDAQIKKHTEEMNIALLTDDTETAKFHARKIKELRK